MKLTAEHVELAIEGLSYDGRAYKPLDRGIIVLIPSIKEQTDTGLYKGQELINEESKSVDESFVVIAVHPQCTNIAPKDSVLPKAPGFILPQVKCPIEGYEYGQMQEYDVYGVFKA